MLDAVPRLLFFQKKNTFTGDHMGMRMRIIMVKPEEGDSFLKAWAWDEPLCFEASDPATHLTAEFPLSEDGLAEACEWMRTQYAEQEGRWSANYTKPKT